jgi:hypothetical protein
VGEAAKEKKDTFFPFTAANSSTHNRRERNRRVCHHRKEVLFIALFIFLKTLREKETNMGLSKWSPRIK